MKTTIRKISLYCGLSLWIFALSLTAQTSKTSYFMNNSYFKSELNPALRPNRGYLNLLGIGNTVVDVNTDKLTLDKVIYIDKTGKPDWTLNDQTERKRLSEGMNGTNKTSINAGIYPFGFGFYAGKMFWSFDLSMKSQTNMNTPFAILDILANGFTETNNGKYDMSDLAINTSNYLQAALGTSFPIGKNLTIGVKAKYLIGIGYVDFTFSKFDANMTSSIWGMNMVGQMKSSISTYSGIPNSNFDFEKFGNSFENFKATPVGRGMAFDLGATYKLFKCLTLSGAITDFGAITWEQQYNTIGNFNYNATLIQSSSPAGEVKELPHLDVKNDKPVNFTTNLTSSFNFGAEYSILKDKISIGVLSTNRLGAYSLSDLMISANLKPLKAFNTSFSYSTANNGFKTFGAAISWTPSWFLNFFLASDYCITKVTKEFIPVSSSMSNVQFGVVIPLRAPKKNTNTIPTLEPINQLIKSDSIPKTATDSIKTTK